MWGEHDGMGWWMVLGSVWFVFFWGAIVWLFVGVMGRRNEGRSREESATEIARRRYASGEISREEFEQIQRDLG
jgi:putative membrane protein